MPITRTVQMAPSRPTFAGGFCPACAGAVELDRNAAFGDDAAVVCGECGLNTPRRHLIREGLALLDPVTWGLLASSMYIGDEVTMHAGESVLYDLTGLSVAKWLHEVVNPPYSAGTSYYTRVYFSETMATVYVTNTSEESPPASQGEGAELAAAWYRFGVEEISAVPAWRQSLYGAANLVASHPSAAIVLIAAGFESFFLETMRIGWKERGLEEAAFDRLSRRNVAISSLVDWLPSAVGRACLWEAPGNLHERWKGQVNERRNDVIHRANVNQSEDDAKASMRVVLECITFLDEAALVRPHRYYRTGSAD